MREVPIQVELTLPDGGTLQGIRRPGEAWLLVDRPLQTGQRFDLHGLERVVAAVIGIPPSTTAIQFLPDFDRPQCAPCGAAVDPPSADACLSRTACPFRVPVQDARR